MGFRKISDILARIEHDLEEFKRSERSEPSEDSRCQCNACREEYFHAETERLQNTPTTWTPQ